MFERKRIPTTLKDIQDRLNIKTLKTFFRRYMLYMELRKKNIAFFSGLGLDIGPFDKPFIPNPDEYGLEVETVDRWSAKDLKQYFPEIKDSSIPDPTFIFDVSANGLLFAPDDKYDFVICSHVIEHVANPFWLITECYRVLKNDGVLYVSAPDGRFSQDRGRKFTDFSYLWDLYEQNIRNIPDERVEDYLRSPCISSQGWVKEVVGKNAITREIIENEKLRSFHVHVWDSINFIDHFFHLSVRANLIWQLLDLFLWENNHYEGVLVVRKRADYPSDRFQASIRQLIDIRAKGDLNARSVEEDVQMQVRQKPEKKSDTVGIVIRTKDRPILLKRALKSVLEQKLQDWNLVIVNDGGDKDSIENIYKLFEAEFKDRCEILHRENSQGMEAASNAGVSKLNSRYLVIHDDDDSWEPEFLEKCVGFLENKPHPNTRGVISYVDRIIERIDGDKIVEVSKDPFNTWYTDISLYRMLSNNMFPPICFLFEKSVYDEIGGFREDLPVLGDWEYHLRFLTHYDIGMVFKRLANYHHRVSNEPSTYDNSVITDDRKHAYYQNLLRNEWLRDDINKGKLGIGFLSNFCVSELRLHEYVFNRVAIKKEGPLRNLMKRINL